MIPDQIRRPGGGRKSIEKQYPNINEIFLAVIAEHIAGDPMNADIRWVKLSRTEISEKMTALGVKISRKIVKKLLKKHKLVKRKMQRKRSTGKSADREQQFKNIIAEKEKFMVRHESAILLATESVAEKVMTRHISYSALGTL